MTPRRERTNTRRHVVIVVSGVVAVVLGATAAWAALGHDPASPEAAAPVATVTPAPPTESTGAPRTPSPTNRPTNEPTNDPTPVVPFALADGTYPTYVRMVDVGDATIRVDVIQVYLGDAARREAREDGMSWKDSEYLHLYIRNENPLLRTLPVASDARIEFVGGCVADDTYVGLRDLYAASTPFTDAYYYEMVIADGAIVDVTQHFAVEGC